MVQIDKYKVYQARWSLKKKRNKKRSLFTSCDNDKDTAGIDNVNFYLHLLVMMKKQSPTTYYDIAHQPIII